MAGFIGTQDFWIAGSRFFFEKNGKMSDFGTIDVVNPEISPSVVDLKDGEKGVLRLLDKALTQVDETYNVTVKNFNLTNLQYLFLGSSFTGSAASGANAASTALKAKSISLEDLNNIGTTATVTGQPITGIKGVYLMQLQNAAGENLRNCNSTTLITITIGGQAQTQGVHWDFYDRAKGIIRINTIGAIAVFSPAVTVTGVVATSIAGSVPLPMVLTTGANAIAGVAANRTMFPQTASLASLQGVGHIYWTRENGANVTVRSFNCQIQPGGVALNTTDYSSWTLAVTVLATGTDAGYEGGTLVSPATATTQTI